MLLFTMEASAEPRHFFRKHQQQQKSKRTGTHVYQNTREEPTAGNWRSKLGCEKPDYPYPSYIRRVTTLPGLDQRITELDDDEDTEDEIDQRGEDRRGPAPTLRDETIGRSGESGTQGLGSGLRSNVEGNGIREGEMHPRPNLKYTKSGYPSPKYERESPERRVAWLDEDEDDLQPTKSNTTHHRPVNDTGRKASDLVQQIFSHSIFSTSAERARLEEGQRAQARFAQAWDSTPFRLTPPLININHFTSLHPLSRIQEHIHNLHAVQSIAQAAFHHHANPQLRVPTLLNHNTVQMKVANMQTEYAHLVSELTINRSMQQEDISVLAASPLYPQHVRMHASHELRQLQAQEHSLLSAIEEIELEIKDARKWSSREPKRKAAGAKKARFAGFGELDLEELSLEDDDDDAEYLRLSTSKGKSKRWMRDAEVVVGNIYEVDDDGNEVSDETKAPLREHKRGKKLRFRVV